MFCRNCGTQIPNNALFCPVCGNKLAQQPPKEKVDSGIAFLVLAIVEFVLLIVLVAGIVLCGNKKFSAQAVAQRYYMAVVNQDWSTAYACVDTEKSAGLCTYSSYLNAIGLYDFDSNAEVEIRSKDENSAIASFGNKEIPLVCIGRKFLIFKDWKVDASTDATIGTGYVFVETYTGDALYVDGMKVEIEPQIEENYPDYQMYAIPTLFRGNHTFSLTESGGSVVELPYAGGEYIDMNRIASNGTIQVDSKALDSAYQAFNDLMSAGMKGQGFNAVAYLFAPESVDAAQANYEAWLTNFEESRSMSYDYGYTHLSFYDVKVCATNIYEQDGLTFASLAVTYTYDYQFVDNQIIDGYGIAQTWNVTVESSENGWVISSTEMPTVTL